MTLGIFMFPGKMAIVRDWFILTVRWETMCSDNLFSSLEHYDDVRMGAIASQITSLTIVYSIVYSNADQRKHQSSASLAFVRGIHRGPVNFPHKWPVTRRMFPFDDVIMGNAIRARAIFSSKIDNMSMDFQCVYTDKVEDEVMRCLG